MSRNRQWYEDVMDVALRATLKEHGFKRKSRTNYVCEHSPERIWIFEIEPWRQHHPFRDWSGIFVPEIEEIVTGIDPEMRTHHTFLREPSQLKASIVELAWIALGRDRVNWEKNPKSRHWLWGRRRPPPITREIPLWDGGWWYMNHVKEVLDKTRTPDEWIMRGYEDDDREPWKRKWDETAEAVGVELDALWRKYAHDWLQKCDDMHFLAEWFDQQVYSPGHPGHETTAATAATAWHLAGNDFRAADILGRLVTENEAIAANKTENTAEYRSYVRTIAEAARKLADKFGIRLK